MGCVENQSRGVRARCVSYEVDARLVQDAGAAGSKVDAAEHVLAGQRQGEERRRGRHAELVSCIESIACGQKLAYDLDLDRAAAMDGRGTLTHVVSDGFAIGEPPGGLAAGVVDAVPGVVGLGEGHREVVVVPHLRHRVAEHVGHRTLGRRRRGSRSGRYREVSRVRSVRIDDDRRRCAHGG